MGTSASTEPAIRAANLVVHRGKSRILHGLDIALPPGSITGLLGPSGCGKTALLRSLVGLQRVTSGKLTGLGRPAGSKPLGRRVASSEDVDRVLATADLTGFAGRPVAALSGGQASRVSLACALVGSPEVLILDEPTVGLDPLTRESLWESFRVLADGGTTLVVSSHVMEEATRCDEVLLIREGRFLAHAPIAQLQHQTSAASPGSPRSCGPIRARSRSCS